FVTQDRVVTAVEDLTLDIERGEFVTVVGPSGGGKSTILNMGSGLLPATGGRIPIDDNALLGVTRDIGYVTQAPNLMAWRTLIDNVSFPLEISGVKRAERHAQARGLNEFEGL